MKGSLTYILQAGAGALALTLAMPLAATVGGLESGHALAQGNQGGGAGKGQMGAGGGGRGGEDGQMRGQGKGRSLLDDIFRADEDGEEDSDRPDWAGTPGREGKPGQPNPTPGISKGGLYGDLYVIVRDANGVPIYYVWQDTDGDGVPDTAVVSEVGYPQPVDADGNLIPLNEEGEPVSEDLLQEVELSRLNISRSPTRVLSSRYLEAITALNEADSVALDASGRLVLTNDGVETTIDSPLENLAIYLELMNTGTLAGVTNPAVAADLANLVDGQYTLADLEMAVSFLAAAADKFGTLNVDQVITLNTILGVDGTIEGPDDITYVDFSDYSYDRAATYQDVNVTVLVETSPGIWEEQQVNVYEALFDSQQATGTAATGFAQAADDALQVIEYVHEYEVPADITTTG